MYYIAIVGRPNVGKSTLFNKIVGGRPAIVDDMPGVTRDRHVAIVERAGHKFGVIDTGGFETDKHNEIPNQIREQAMMAVEEADIIFFVMDGRAGVTPLDSEIAIRLRKSGKPVLPVVNKMDNPATHDEAVEFSSLGLGDAYIVSAEHSIGISNLLESALGPAKDEEDEVEQESEIGKDEPMRIAVVGKPNVGKSSLVNRMLGAERMLVSDVAGTTRDAIDSEVTMNGKKFTFIDTAGIRRKAKVTMKLEKFSVIMAMKAIDRADVALLLIDASEGITVQDAKIAGLIEDAGCGCVVVVNKWDIVEKDDRTVYEYTDMIHNQLKFMTHAPIIFISAKTGQRVEKIFESVEEVYEQYIKRVTTSKLNDFLEEATRSKPPPQHRSKRVKLYYGTQIKTCPPTFVFMSNAPEGVHFSYRRYLTNQLRSEMGFEKTPVKIIFRKPADRRSNVKRTG